MSGASNTIKKIRASPKKLKLGSTRFICSPICIYEIHKIINSSRLKKKTMNHVFSQWIRGGKMEKGGVGFAEEESFLKKKEKTQVWLCFLRSVLFFSAVNIFLLSDFVAGWKKGSVIKTLFTHSLHTHSFKWGKVKMKNMVVKIWRDWWQVRVQGDRTKRLEYV
jgi:hypothetical protein